MKRIVPSEDISVMKLGENYVVYTPNSSKFFLVNNDAYSILHELVHMSASMINDIYYMNTTFWDTLSSNGIVMVFDDTKKGEK